MKGQEASIQVLEGRTGGYPVYWIPTKHMYTVSKYDALNEQQNIPKLEQRQEKTYQATEIQLEGDRSELLYVLSAGNWDARTAICWMQEDECML